MEIPFGAFSEIAEQVGKVALRKEISKQKKEHPSAGMSTITQISIDHVKAGKDGGFYGHSISGKTDCFYKGVSNTTGKKRI